MEEFCLSEKEEYIDERGENDELAKQMVFKKKDVKKFIKILKEELNDKYPDLCYDTSGFDLERLIDIINKLSGEKLI